MAPKGYSHLPCLSENLALSKSGRRCISICAFRSVLLKVGVSRLHVMMIRWESKTKFIGRSRQDTTQRGVKYAVCFTITKKMSKMKTKKKTCFLNTSKLTVHNDPIPMRHIMTNSRGTDINDGKHKINDVTNMIPFDHPHCSPSTVLYCTTLARSIVRF